MGYGPRRQDRGIARVVRCRRLCPAGGGMSGGTSQANSRLWGARPRDWAEVQEGQFAAAYHAVLAHAGVGHGTLHLDAGCGAGMAAALSASLGARVAGIDAAEGMLEIARERVPSGDFRLGDLEALPWDDNSFDLVTGFNAIQFAGDAAQALREAGRVTRPGGRIVIMTWGDPSGMEAAGHLAALKPLLPPPPPGAPGPFALSDEAALRAFAEAGGLMPGEIFDVDTPWHYPDKATALRGIGSSGMAVKAIEHSGEAAFTAAVTEFMVPFHKADGSIGFGASARYLVATPARKPGQ
ncbi:class I SAM-dependent methyltransferase [Pseudotabrizicola sediminis]|uniref:Class I SAM-dependent methyltransferase n=2 Tax=Pseudotabrizicola sediminis TaxID=2486418 RepID=A0ABY2KKE2_9RHOB|nr:class I SAM-dependent methyltransferase [Pseudotabrizicola sediminis]